jgi:hypothetical protein
LAITLDQLKKLCEGEDFKYFLAPDRPMVMLGFGGVNGSFQVIVPIEVDGRFMQVRTMSYLHCPADHPHVNAVLAVLGSLNYRLRMTKFGWDPKDGEIVAYADVWVEDGEVTQKQFGALFRSLIPSVDLNFKRLSVTIETGEDPGEASAKDMLGATLPSELRGLLKKITDAESDDEDEDADEDADDKAFDKV